jgi:hypothetical protein
VTAIGALILPTRDSVPSIKYPAAPFVKGLAFSLPPFFSSRKASLLPYLPFAICTDSPVNRNPGSNGIQVLSAEGEEFSTCIPLGLRHSTLQISQGFDSGTYQMLKPHTRGWNTIQAIRGHRRLREVEWEMGGEAPCLTNIEMSEWGDVAMFDEVIGVSPVHRLHLEFYNTLIDELLTMGLEHKVAPEGLIRPEHTEIHLDKPIYCAWGLKNPGSCVAGVGKLG